MSLSARQQQVLAWMREFALREQRAPRIREMCAYWGWKSTNSAATYIDAIEREGGILRDEDGTIRRIGNVVLAWAEVGA
jgi:SOS-response transcriptional repressor LexA